MTYNSEVLADSPYFYWECDEASGTTAADASGNSHPGTYSVSTMHTTGIIGAHAAALAGVTDYVNIAGGFGPGTITNFSMEVIVAISPGSAATQPTIFGSELNNPVLGINADGTVIFAPGLVSPINGSVAIDDGVGHHIVGTYDGTTGVAKLYIDGVLDVSTTVGTGSTDIGSGVDNWQLGNGTFNDPSFTATADEAAFYTATLNATRIAAHATAGGFPLPHSMAVPLLAASPTFFTPSIGQPTTPAGTSPAPYVVKVVDIFGGNAATLASALPAEIVWTLNEPTEATISFPKPAYSKTDVPTLATPSAMREIQIYRDGDIMFWGAMIHPDAQGSRGDVTCNCVDPLWYLYRRNIDEPRVNFLHNPDFESGTADWTANGGITFTADTTRKVLGSHSAKLANLTAGGDTHIRQNFTAGPNGVGLLLTCSGWFFLESITAPAFGSIGLYLAGGRGGVIEDFNFYAIDTATQTNVWTRVEFTVWIPPNQVWDMQCKAFAPEGVIYWDALQVVAMDSIGSGNVTGSAATEADIARITRVLVNHVQSSAAGKSNLNIGNHCPDTGVTLFRQYQFAEHTSFQDALGEFVKRDDGFDISLEVTPTTRTFETFYPTKGTDRTASVTLTYGGNVADYRFSKDGAGAITRATTFGQGDGPDREEGEYADTTQLGGLVLQEVRAAEQDATINSLLPTSRERVRLRKKPPLLLELDIRPSANLIHTLKVGDTVNVVVSDGYVTVSGHHRIVKIKLDCKTNLLTAFVNEELT